MDVLQLLKNELKDRQNEIARITGSCSAAQWTQVAHQLQAYLSLELEFLLPELLAVFPRMDPVLLRLENELLALQRQLMQIGANILPPIETLGALREALDRHAFHVEDRILPLMRQRISTSDREELYDALHDAKHEIMQATAGFAIS